MGFEPMGLHRIFSSIGYEINFDGFKKDIDNVSLNTGLYYDEVDKLLFRTSITDYKSGDSVMQLYKDKIMCYVCDTTASAVVQSKVMMSSDSS